MLQDVDFAIEVGVNCHGGAANFFGEAAHGHSIITLLLEKIEGAVDDFFTHSIDLLGTAGFSTFFVCHVCFCLINCNAL